MRLFFFFFFFFWAGGGFGRGRVLAPSRDELRNGFFLPSSGTRLDISSLCLVFSSEPITRLLITQRNTECVFPHLGPTSFRDRPLTFMKLLSLILLSRFFDAALFYPSQPIIVSTFSPN